MPISFNTLESFKSVYIELQRVFSKIENKERINNNDAILLFEKAPVGLLAYYADLANKRLNADLVYFNKNIHIEPTNYCIYNCKFCSYSAHASGKGWKMNRMDIIEKIENVKGKITEVHIVGGVYPEYDFNFYADLFKEIKSIAPNLHIKALTAIEIKYIIEEAKLSIPEGIQMLKLSGLDSVPGGGAEIFDQEVRQEICGLKDSAEDWLMIHEELHKAGIPSNSTILYGHIETIEHRVDHLSRLRALQDKTKGFNAFIPLKFKNKHNQLSNVPETSIIDDLRMYAVSRIYLDNFRNIKAYWPMLGKQVSQLLLDFGVNDLDGTINDSTKIYSMAGSNESNPEMTTENMVKLVTEAGKKPVERDSVYNSINMF